MGIQHRRGSFNRFDPTRMTPGEWAVVQSDDPYAIDGMAVYICFEPGVVKRMTTYEDFLDWFAEARQTTLDEMLEDATEEVVAEYAALTEAIENAENLRVMAENGRATAEGERQDDEEARIMAENARAAAESARQATIAGFTQQVADGDFNGATFAPMIDAYGNLSWTNDKGLDNPESINIKGEKGNDGIVVDLESGLYAFEIIGDDLYLICDDPETVPKFELRDDGCIWVKIGE